MRVLLCHNLYQSPGGEDAVWGMERRLLEERGHTVVDYVRHNAWIGRASPHSVALDTVWARQSYSDIRELIRRSSPDVAHFHNTFPLISPAAYYACKTSGVPVVQTLHNYRVLCPSSTQLYRAGELCEACLGKTVPWPGVAHRCYRASAIQTAVLASTLTLHRLIGTWGREVDAYVALTGFAREEFIAGGLPADRLFVKPNAVHPDPGDSRALGEFAMFVGRLSEEKGSLTLLEAWRSSPRTPLKIVGDGPLLEYARGFASAHGLQGVEFLGFQEPSKVLALMKRAWFLVFASQLHEGFGLTIAEAYACGRPVVAAGLGAIRDLVKDGETGVHFIPGDAEDLARQVEWALSHPQEMEAMGRRARKEYESNYTGEICYERLMEIYGFARGRT